MNDSPRENRRSIQLVMLIVSGWMLVLAGGVGYRVWLTTGDWTRAALGAAVVLAVGGVFVGLWFLLFRKFRRRP